MALNGGLNLGLGKLKTVIVSFGLAYFPPIIFAFTAMVLGIGILPSLKVILRYPATFVFPATTIVFAAPVEYESKSCVPCKSFANSIQYRLDLTWINSILTLIMRILIFVVLPQNGQKIVTESDTGINEAFGYLITANQMSTFMIATRGPWTTTPALIKAEERGQNQQTFMHSIFFSKPHALFWEKAQPVPSVF